MPRPWISTNLAVSADGKISTVSRRPSGWTSTEDHRRLLELRKDAGALLVGRGTLEGDRMTLTAPGNPLRCIVSRSGHLDPAHPIFGRPGGPIHLLVTGRNEPPALPAVTVHHLTLAGFLEHLAEARQVDRLHCEGGGELIRSLAELDAIDEFHLTLAGHALFGGAEAPTATGMAGDFLPASRRFSLEHFEPRPDLGECFLTYVRQRGD